MDKERLKQQRRGGVIVSLSAGMDYTGVDLAAFREAGRQMGLRREQQLLGLLAGLPDNGNYASALISHAHLNPAR